MPYRFTFTSEIVRSLQIIEQSKAEVNLTVLPPAMAESLRLRARVRSTHFSTRIEGNRLTLVEAEQAVLDGQGLFQMDQFLFSARRPRSSLIRLADKGGII